MQKTLTLAAVVAGLGQVAATGFHQAPIFHYPGNTDNKCIPKQYPGYKWEDLSPGGFNKYGGFNWKGYTCENKFSKRDDLAPRTLKFQEKCITGIAHPDKNKCPSFSCDKEQGLDYTSIKEFYITVEFDCDMEFHYEMPGGKTCKHRSPCKKGGSIIKNTQCGGAKGVTVVYPPQPNKPKPSCAYGFHSIGFDCNTYSTKPPKPTTTTSVKPTTSAPPPVTTTSTTPVSSVYIPSSSTPTTMATSTVPSTSSQPATTVYTPSTPGVSTTSDIKPTTTTTTPSSSDVKSTSSVPGSVYTPSGSTGSDVQSSTSSPGSVYTPSTSDVRTTSDVKPTSSLPGPTTTTTTTTPGSVYTPSGSTSSDVKPTTTQPGPSTSTPGSVYIPSSSSPGSVYIPSSSTPGSVYVPSSSTSGSASVPVSSTSSAPGPIETLPCPAVVPSCLNTFLDMVGNCKSNTDTACFCPNADYVKAIFDCIYAHGETDAIILEAITYFQGICASHCGENPIIATGAETITNVITVTNTVQVTGYTTVKVDATQVVAITGEDGATIPGSSTTVFITTTLAVPDVGFATVTAGSQTSVAIVPGSYATAQPSAVPFPTQTRGPTTLVTAPGGGSQATATGSTPVVTAGAAHVRSGLSLLGLAAMAVVAL
jgi:hypothetical protein